MPNDQPNPPFADRCLYPRLNSEGGLIYNPVLTHCSRTDPVDIVIGKVRALPIVFVPGIMGSNLKVKGGVDGKEFKVWTVDSKAGIALQQLGKSAGDRQRLMHPDRTEVDPGGAVPRQPIGVLRNEAHFRQRGWGEVSAVSYQNMLIWLEEHFNGQRGSGIGHSSHEVINATLRSLVDRNGWEAQKPFEPLTQAESSKAEAWQYPVYVCGYNWLASNEVAATRLASRVDAIIEANNSVFGDCEQVIVVTHSMGGLVARRCAQLPGMDQKIAGVVHGVMPAIGASVAYRRCKIGMWDEDAATSLVIGRTGKEITAVFAQSPGALELLPTSQYTREWLQIYGDTNPADWMETAARNPYQELYQERIKWWGPVKEAWLSPQDGKPIDWEVYIRALGEAAKFHAAIKNSYHPNTWAFYGRAVPTFDRVTWRYEVDRRMDLSSQPLMTPEEVRNIPYDQAHLNGTHLEYLDGPPVQRMNPQLLARLNYPSTYVLRLTPPEGEGDGTVPVSSGRAPLQFVRQLFAVPGLGHEPAYQSVEAQQITAYAIAKIASMATCTFDKPAIGARQ